MKNILIGIIVILLLVGVYGVWVNLSNKEELKDEHIDLWGQGDTRISASASALVGVWKSLDDSQFRREFKSDGKVIDSYSGKSTGADQGTWNVFTKESFDKEYSGSYENGVVYLRINMYGQRLYFKLIKVTPTELEMVYQGQGNTLRFSKI